MVIYGGIDRNNRYLSDVWEFYISNDTCSWRTTKISLGDKLKDNLGIAYHTMVAVYD